MTGSFHCDSCGRRIGRRGRHYAVAGGALLLCTACAQHLAVHRDVYPGCGERHTCLDHGAHAVSRASAACLRQWGTQTERTAS